MAEATAAEPNEGAVPSPRRPRRKHAINLCCAQSVQAVVEEVARNLQGLGFSVRVICGAQARAALLGSRAQGDEPTIHVVCVQGSLQERVLKPLRQALSTHGGPNQHLFVAVLDLGVPLAMVGQIRRFAEALERPQAPGPAGPDGTVERRSWREHTPHREPERTGSRSVPPGMAVVERKINPGSQATTGPRRTKTLSSRHRAVKIGPTSKYRAVTASHGVVPPEEPVSKRGRGRGTGSGLLRAGRLRGGPLSTPAESTAPPPPPTGKRHPSGSVPAAVDAPPSPSKRETDAARPRSGGLRFTPPSVKAAEVGTRSGRFVPVPPSTGPNKTVPAPGRDSGSHARLQPPTVSPEDRTTRYGQGDLQAEIEAIEARTKAAQAAARADGPTSTDKTVVAHVHIPRPPITGPNKVVGAGPAETAKATETDDTPSIERKVTRRNEAVRANDSSTTLLRPSTPTEDRGESDDDEIAESDKTLLRSDGTFENARTLLRGLGEDAKKAVERAELASMQEVERPTLVLDPEEREDDVAGTTGKKKTVLYGEDGASKATAEGAEISKAPAEEETAEEAVADRAPPFEDVDEDEMTIERVPSPRRPPSQPLPRRSSTAVATDVPRSKTERTPSSSHATTEDEPRREGGGWVWLVVITLLVGGGVGTAYLMGLFGEQDPGDRERPTTAARSDRSGQADEGEPAAGDEGEADEGEAADDAAAADGVPTTAGDADAAAGSTGDGAPGSTGDAEAQAGSTGGATPAASDDGSEPEPASDDGAEPEPASDDGAEPEPASDDGAEPEPEPEPEPKPEPAPAGQRLTPEEKILAKAADRREIVMLKTLFASKRQGDSTTWSGGNLRCAGFEVDGVKGWRLPHRREMKLLNAVLSLPGGVYWTFTVPKDDRQAAYVLDTGTGQLSLFLKSEPTGEVLCVRRRKHPDK